MTSIPAKDIIGRRIDLSDNRFVFVGAAKQFPDDKGLIFRNAAGEYTSFRLSPEALAALTSLLTDPTAGVEGAVPAPPKDDMQAFTFTAEAAWVKK